jgi:hypothetical protein
MNRQSTHSFDCEVMTAVLTTIMQAFGHPSHAVPLITGFVLHLFY